ncbi:MULTISPECIES: GmrSD restriction endonuclease domain-containing protein [Mycobacterium avium complex (MAC)]|uniref:GmrSD restriction endonucleases N-terminal domain-containing protein n=1 Tax=Mycobacterium paraintracellulare TaxID=1138383 RepID=A0ABN6AR27_9MYCO|nr:MULTISPECIES: DUF262 domain-containing protein [Mycobacterium avium complex (MAC)]AFC53134.1 hypothetical protein OCQ_16220 [Mycobacterium paraintracellulare]MEE3755013.1 DUF262 domain-containing protein [Mycobacterium intracellulare]OSC24579.1 hypothetical protein B8W68_16275 [Mycobacterium paraintracellulare]BBY71302.1 hypothetical protein MPRI_34890 [Mycobacterium paraintracellulare]
MRVSLLPGEAIHDLKRKDVPPVSDADLNRRYSKEGVRIVIEQARYPLNQILAMFTDTFVTESGETEAKYKRDPEYQRRHRWDEGRQSRLIESFLMNVPVPPVFLYEYELARFEVMDGRQRLTALMEFYQGKLHLTGLQHWPELNGRTYSTLPSSIRDGIDRRYLSSIILLNETASDPEQAAFLKKLVFERLNSGGVRLSGQETRNAVYDGPLNDLCLRLSRITELRSVLGTPLDPNSLADPDTDEESDDDGGGLQLGRDAQGVEVTAAGLKLYKAMEDVEIVLRFFAYRHFDKFTQGLNKISEFLDEFLVRGNRFDQDTLAEYEQIFVDNITFWHAVGGPVAFQVKNSNRHFSKIAYDALMYASSALSGEQRAALLTQPTIVKAAVDLMYDQHSEVFGGRRTNAADARNRNDHAYEALNAALIQIEGQATQS